jgi:hypothetical protein
VLPAPSVRGPGVPDAEPFPVFPLRRARQCWLSDRSAERAFCFSR